MVWPRRRVYLGAVLAILLLPWAGAAPAGAQGGKVTDQAKAPAGKGDLPARKVPQTLLELIVAGGPLNIAFLGVLGLFSLVALTVILERLGNLTRRKLIPEGFIR